MQARVVALLLASLIASTTVGCTSNVPVGFDSGTSSASRDVAAPAADVEQAARAMLAERGDAVETEVTGEVTVLRTGRYWIRIEPRAGGTTHLQVQIARYVGADNQDRVDESIDKILGHLR